MHHQNIDTLRQEAQRQIQILKTLLLRAQEQGLISAAAQDSDSRATFDAESLPKALEVLDGEFHKLSNLEMVLAVVGTMKAGKSTTINAIVGAEVLPNRNRPMTALPTLIRHTPGVHQPQLVFEKVKPLNDLLVSLQAALGVADPAVLDDLQSEPDMNELLEQIRKNRAFAKRYEGEEGIFQFLKRLNDLVRVCFALQVEFPFAQYATVDAMPVIEVEFTHLKNLPSTQGRLTLLDTPGPNEAGQTHLRHMLKDQLKKASAVLAVLDYTQLKSDADNDVRSNLLAVADTAQDRMYALVNKFDQRNRNSDGPDEVKQYVSQTLMRGILSADNVFPVSANQGYLASRARNEMERYGKLNVDEAWVADFGAEAIGRRWEQKIDDSEEVKLAADDLWKESGFEMPLDDVIVRAHQNAALEALRSAVAKLNFFIKDVNDFLKINIGSLKTTAENLKNNIDSLHRNIESINSVEYSINDALDTSLRSVTNKVEASSENIKAEILSSLTDFLKKGREIENASLKNKNNEKTERAKKRQSKKKDKLEGESNSWFNFSWKKDDKPEKMNDYLAKAVDGVIGFDSREKADEFKGKVESVINYLFEKYVSEIGECIENGVIDFSSALEKTKKTKIMEIEKSIQENLNDFDVKINFPDLSLIRLDESVQILFDQTVKSKTRQVSRRRRKDSMWGTFCSWFDTDDWGWESYLTEEEYFEVDLNFIENNVNKSINKLFEAAQSTLDKEVYPQLQSGVNEFFSIFREKLSHIRGDFIHGVQRQSLQREEKENVLLMLTDLLNVVRNLEIDCSTLSDCVENLFSEKEIFIIKGEVIA